FDIEDHEQLRKEIAESVIFTTATGVGMNPFEGETLLPSADMLRPELIVSDVVYKPTKTRLLEIAEEQGWQTLKGLGMMLWQGAKAFEIWTHKEM
ncbi:quinate/shikimate dehydrogenase, partial [Listeria monocytogenes]|nr:quinate/shikimate dehydrogenase [Listeria monocytogenes]